MAAVIVAPLALGACGSAYYKAMEAFGKEKRDILASRVSAARADQSEAKEQFQSALDRFTQLIGSSGTAAADGGELRKVYDAAKADLERSEAKANDVRSRITAIEKVGKDLFDEWDEEIDQYSSAELKAQSRAQMKQTRRRYDDMLAAMQRAAKSMDPVLAAFRDNVLFLKHNLNAQAVASLEGTVKGLQRDIASLIREMEQSIAQADRFVQELQQGT